MEDGKQPLDLRGTMRENNSVSNLEWCEQFLMIGFASVRSVFIKRCL